MIPSALHQLAYHKKLRSQDFATVFSIISGAAHLPPILAAYFKKAIQAGPEFAFSEGTYRLLFIRWEPHESVTARFRHVRGGKWTFSPDFRVPELSHCRQSVPHANQHQPCSTAGYLLFLALPAFFCLA